ncbi:MAG: hypothetical protein JWQ09_2720 [Segetibacter sp.]|nr:hypothetical protein [Segetibacter sp.]
MNDNTPDAILQRKELLKKIAETYFESLRNKNFSSIPYEDNIKLRVPLVPGGVNNPVQGKELIYAQWWQPLEPALEGVQINILDHYYNESLTAIISEAEITLANPAITLRAADRFTINNEGKIIEQENHFDASSLTNPG